MNKLHCLRSIAPFLALCCLLAPSVGHAQNVAIIAANTADRIIRDSTGDGMGNAPGNVAGPTAFVGEAFADTDESRYYLPFELTEEHRNAVLATPSFLTPSH